MILRRWLRKVFENRQRLGDVVRERRAKRLRVRPRLEVLEERLAPTAYQWTGADVASGNSKWSDKNNWSPMGMPRSGDTVDFNSSAMGLTSTVDEPFTVSAMTVEGSWGGAIQINSSLTITASSQWASGTFSFGTGTVVSVGSGAVLDLTGGNTVTYSGAFTGSGAGVVQLASGTLNAAGATFDFPPGMFQWSNYATINGGSAGLTNLGAITADLASSNVSLTGLLDNEGTITEVGTGLDTGDDGTGGTSLYLNGQIINDLGATYDLQADAAIEDGGNNNSTLTNMGLVEMTSGPGTSDVGVTVFENSGSVDVPAGVLTLDAPTVSGQGGPVTVATGAALSLAPEIATMTITGTYTGSGAGIVTLSGNTLDAAGATFDFPPGMFQWSNYATISGGSAGLTNLGNISVITTASNVFLSGLLDNEGTIVQTGTSTLFINSSGQLVNESGATYDFQSDGSVQDYGNNSSTLTNLGVVEKTSGTGASGIYPGVFQNSGSLDVQTGTVALQTTVSGTGGAVTVAAGAVLALTSEGVTTISGTYTGSGSGSVVLDQGTLDAAGATFDFPPGMFQWGGTYPAEPTLDGGTSGVTNLGSIIVNTNGDAALLNGLLDNQGTIVQTGASTLVLGISGEASQLVNETGGTYDFQSDGSIQDDGNNNSSLTNQGLLEKTGGTGTSMLATTSVSNTGTVEVDSGTVTVTSAMLNNSGGMLNVVTGLLVLEATTVENTGAAIMVAPTGELDLTGGQTVTYSGTLSASGGGTVVLASGTLIGSGLTLDFPSGMFQWGGNLPTLAGGTVGVTNIGSITVAGSVGDAVLSGLLVNEGTIVQTVASSPSFSLGNGNILNGFAQLTNEPGATYDFASAGCSIQDGGNNNSTLTNMGLIEMTGGAGTVQIGSILDGIGGTIDVPAGELALSGGSTGGTSFSVASGATVNLEGGTFSGSLSGSGLGALGTGTVELTGGGISPAIGGVTLNFPGNMFQWTGGSMNLQLGNVTNASTGTINISGSNGTEIFNGGTLDNFGTIVQTGTGGLGIHGTTTTLMNEAGASYLIESDSGVNNLGGGIIVNDGTIEKTGGTGTSSLSVSGTITNTGTIEADSGTLSLDASSITQISGTTLTLTGGTWSALNGATLEFPSGTSIDDNAATVSLGGAGSAIVGISGLSANSGSFSVTAGADFDTAGDFTNSGTLTVGAGSTLTVGGSYMQASTGTFNEQIGGTPGRGQFGQLVVTGTAMLGGAFNVALVNGFAASEGQSYEAIVFAVGSNVAFSSADLGSSFTEAINPTSVELDSTVVNPTNLSVGEIMAPTMATAGQQITVMWQVTNESSTDSAAGAWQDSVYLSTTESITPSSILLGSAERTGGLDADASYNGSLTAALPALAPEDYYVLVEADSLYQVTQSSRAGDIGYAMQQLDVMLPAITLGANGSGSVSGVFSAADESQYCQVTVLPGDSLQVTLDSSASSGAVALYVGPFVEPTPYGFAYAGDVPNQPEQTVLVPAVGNQTTDPISSTTYDILAQGVSGAAATAGFTLTATTAGGLTVLAPATPYVAGNGGPATFQIDGTGFSQTPSLPTASLTLGGTVIADSSVYYQSATAIFATFNLSGAALGNYSLSVTNAGETVTSPAMLQVITAVNASNPVQLVLTPPAEVSAGRDSVVTVTVTNVSNNDVLAPLLQLTGDGATLKLPSQSEFEGPSLYFLATSPTGPAGTLTGGESVQVQVQFMSTTTNPTINFQLNQSDDSANMDWASQASALQIPTIPDAAWPIVFNNFADAMTDDNTNSTVGAYHQVLAADATDLAQLGQPTDDVLQLVEFEIQKANAAYTTQTLDTVTADDLPAPGFDLTFQQSYLASISGRYYVGILGALGWTTNWDITATTTSTGVAVQMSGSSFYFFLQPNGSYQPEPGDEGEILTSTTSGYRLTEPDGTVYQFNPPGSDGIASLAYVADSNGNTVLCGYNSSGQLATLTDSNGEYLTLGYTNGQMTSLTDSNGQTETYVYSGQQLMSYTDDYGTTQYTYFTGGTTAQNGSLSQITFAYGTPVSTNLYFNYDSSGQLSEEYQGSPTQKQQDETFTYVTPAGTISPDGDGIKTTDGDGHSTTSFFNLYGATCETIDGAGNVTQYRYDSSLNLVQVVAPGNLSYSYSYDVNGNLLSETDPLGYTTSFTYNSNNDLTSYTDANGHTTGYGYDNHNNLMSITYANGASELYQNYNPLGEAADFVNANGDVIDLTYNDNGQVTGESVAGGLSYIYTYNAQGNLTKAVDTQGHETIFLYQDQSNPNLLTEVDYPDGTYLTFQYNVLGQRTQSMDQTGFTVKYVYDAVGRLSELTDANNSLIAQYIYDAAGNLHQKNNGNGTFTIYAYDPDNRVTSITNYAPSAGGTPYDPTQSAVNSFDDYTYDGLGNVRSDTSQEGVWQYQYDADSQLIQAIFMPSALGMQDGLTAQNLGYVYDPVGNRISETVNGVTTTYMTNPVNEYASSTVVGTGDTTMYGYDLNGNLTSVQPPGGSQGTTYTYNPLNELTGVSAPGVTASYAYNPLGEMVYQSVNGTITNYQVDPAGLGNVVAAFSGTGVYQNTVLQANYVYGLGLVSQASPGAIASTASYYDLNVTGSTVGITGSGGSYMVKYAYLPFGQVTAIPGAGGGTANPFTFVGQFGARQNGTGLLVMGVRAYDPGNGRFIERDPLNVASGDTNLVRYAANNPLSRIDPGGLQASPTKLLGLGDAIRDLQDIASGDCVTRAKAIGDLIGGVIGDAIFGGAVLVDVGLIAAAVAQALAVIPLSGGTAALAEIEIEIEVAITATLIYNVGGFLGSQAYSQLGALIGRIIAEKACPCGCPPGNAPDATCNPGPNGSTPNNVSRDPSTVIGPVGYGVQGYIQPAGNWSYTIDFENYGTAAALDVTVTEQLDPNLDWSTFVFGSFGFGPVNVVVPAGLAEYQATVTYQNSDGTPLDVLVNLAFSAQTGMLTASFVSLDPATGEAPTGVFDGFLYPENGTGVGRGYVQYAIQPKANLATGATINQEAMVTFDTNPPETTLPPDNAFNTIDAGPVTSHVNALPATSGPVFSVTWSGGDGGGAGIASYAVYVSEDGGPYVAWLTDTTLSSAPYAGQIGHNYAFTSQATDYVGIVEAEHTTADTETTVQAAPISVAVTSTADDNDGGTLSDPAGADGTLSLREAIALANANSGFANAITFDVGAGSQTIDLLTALPTISGPVIIDATPPANFAGQEIVLDGAGIGPGVDGPNIVRNGSMTPTDDHRAIAEISGPGMVSEGKGAASNDKRVTGEGFVPDINQTRAFTSNGEVGVFSLPCSLTPDPSHKGRGTSRPPSPRATGAPRLPSPLGSGAGGEGLVGPSRPDLADPQANGTLVGETALTGMTQWVCSGALQAAPVVSGDSRLSPGAMRPGLPLVDGCWLGVPASVGRTGDDDAWAGWLAIRSAGRDGEGGVDALAVDRFFVEGLNGGWGGV